MGIDDSGPLVSVVIPTRPAAGAPGDEERVRTYLRLTLFAPGTTQALELPQFPRSAPRLEEAVEEESL